MGCDIHAHAEKMNASGQWVRLDIEDPLGGRDYGKFGFLAGVRNYSEIKPIAELRGIPDDASLGTKDNYEAWEGDAHSASWLTLDELLAVDYGQFIEDRRCMKQTGQYWDGAATCEPGEGKCETLSDFLGGYFLKLLHSLKDQGVERIVFWFDN